MRIIRYTLTATLLAMAFSGISHSEQPAPNDLSVLSLVEPEQAVMRRLPPTDTAKPPVAETLTIPATPAEQIASTPLELPAFEPIQEQPAPQQQSELQPQLELPVAFEPVREEPALQKPLELEQPALTRHFEESKEAVVHRKLETVETKISRAELLKIQLPAEVVTRTKTMLEDATTLANRGAHYAAREQFEKIMRVTCQALDAQVGRPIHTRGLARGLRAIEEADDFGLNGDSAEADLHLGGFIAGHSTPVLKDISSSEITTIFAMQSYYRYAVDQLSIAGNNEPITSKALFSLGRIESILSSKNGDLAGGGPKALAFYHAALAVDARNGRAANELGVMLARRGRLHDARNVLQQAARSEPNALVNLSKVYQRLGDAQRSQIYGQQARAVATRSPNAFRRGPASGVRWVNNTTFVKEGAGSDVMPAASPIRRAANAPAVNTAAPANYQLPVAAPQKNVAPKNKRAPFSWGK